MGNYNNLITWYKSAGYDFDSDSFLEEIKSEKDITSTKETLLGYADKVSSTSKKQFSKGQRAGLIKALNSDTISGSFESSLNEREELTKTDAVEYIEMIERIKGLKQISETDEFKNEYKDIEESPEIQRTKGIRAKQKKEIVDVMTQARIEKEIEKYSPTKVEAGIRRGVEQGESVSTILKVNLPAWMLKEKGTEYETYKEMAEEQVRAEKEEKREVEFKKFLGRREEE